MGRAPHQKPSLREQWPPCWAAVFCSCLPAVRPGAQLTYLMLIVLSDTRVDISCEFWYSGLMEGKEVSVRKGSGKKVWKKASQETFRKNSKVHKKNMGPTRPLRGGIRA